MKGMVVGIYFFGHHLSRVRSRVHPPVVMFNPARCGRVNVYLIISDLVTYKIKQKCEQSNNGRWLVCISVSTRLRGRGQAALIDYLRTTSVIAVMSHIA